MATTQAMVSTTTGEAKPKKGLLDLPPEIWSKIGKMVVDDTALFQTALHNLTYHDEFNEPLSTSTLQTVRQPPITRTCKALREELLSHYYKTSMGKIWWGIESTDFPFMGKWIRAIGPENRSHLRGLQLSSYGTPNPVKKIADFVKDVWKIEDKLILVARGGMEHEDTYKVSFG